MGSCLKVFVFGDETKRGWRRYLPTVSRMIERPLRSIETGKDLAAKAMIKKEQVRKEILESKAYGLQSILEKDQTKIIILAELLTEFSPNKRFKILFELERIAENHPEYDWKACLPFLVFALQCDSIERYTAESLLRNIAAHHPEYVWTGAITELIARITDKNPFGEHCASNALAKIGLPAIPELLKLVFHEDPEVRTAVKSTLRKINGSGSRDAKCLAMRTVNSFLRSPEFQDNATRNSPEYAESIDIILGLVEKITSRTNTLV